VEDEMPILETLIGVVIKEGAGIFTHPLKDQIFPKKSKAARKIYALYEAIDECQDAYIKAIEWNSGRNIDDYDEKLRKVADAICDLRWLLRIYDDSLVEILGHYLAMGSSPDPGQIMERLKAKDVDQSDYTNAKDKLEEFIRKNFKMDDLL
jgi:hypothetical protein